MIRFTPEQAAQEQALRAAGWRWDRRGFWVSPDGQTRCNLWAALDVLRADRQRNEAEHVTI